MSLVETGRWWGWFPTCLWIRWRRSWNVWLTCGSMFLGLTILEFCSKAFECFFFFLQLVFSLCSGSECFIFLSDVWNQCLIFVYAGVEVWVHTTVNHTLIFLQYCDLCPSGDLGHCQQSPLGPFIDCQKLTEATGQWERPDPLYLPINLATNSLLLAKSLTDSINISLIHKPVSTYILCIHDMLSLKKFF